ncbi:hypothetical protein [Brucella tritici]|uniref:Uncharacterized protein n=1 Tax=Brucella tritici TaxID=94626 RepID=A0A6L3YW43_9HYPH|nr:hypothetical protein [Brucella tritici]KAB2689656.1 hypothetical protein F9L08_03080 [Brucella tritici]
MKKTYLVTERAGEWVAGQRKPENGRLNLSDDQAAYELALGSIELASPETGPETKKQRRRAGK